MITITVDNTALLFDNGTEIDSVEIPCSVLVSGDDVLIVKNDSVIRKYKYDEIAGGYASANDAAIAIRVLINSKSVWDKLNNISINANSVNLNVDELEGLVEETNNILTDQITQLNNIDVSVDEIKATQQDGSQKTQISNVVNIQDAIMAAQTTGIYNGKIAKVFNILGRRSTFVSTTVFQDVGEALATNSHGFILTNNTAIKVVSNNTGDSNAGGAGVQRIRITYIDTSNNLAQSPDINLNGTTAVNIGFNINDLLWFEAVSVGSNAAAIGTIKIQQQSDNTVLSQITAGGNKSMDAYFKIPAGYSGYIIGWSSGCLANQQDVRIRVTANIFTKEVNTNVYKFLDNTIVPANTTSAFIPLYNMKFLELTKIKCSTITSSTQAATRCDSGFTILIIQN